LFVDEDGDLMSLYDDDESNNGFPWSKG
jgi:hypothetical protein